MHSPPRPGVESAHSRLFNTFFLCFQFLCLSCQVLSSWERVGDALATLCDATHCTRKACPSWACFRCLELPPPRRPQAARHLALLRRTPYIPGTRYCTMYGFCSLSRKAAPRRPGGRRSKRWPAGGGTRPSWARKGACGRAGGGSTGAWASETRRVRCKIGDESIGPIGGRCYEACCCHRWWLVAAQESENAGGGMSCISYVPSLGGAQQEKNEGVAFFGSPLLLVWN